MIFRGCMFLLSMMAICWATLAIADDLKDESAKGQKQLPASCSAAEILLSTTAAPPNKTMKWQYYLNVKPRLIPGAETMVFGDSIARAWPSPLLSELFNSKAVLNLAVGGDWIENTLWWSSLPQLKSISPRRIIVLVGTNNLTRQDSVCTITRGTINLIHHIRTTWPDADLLFIEIPPRGIEFKFRDEDRRQINAFIRQSFESDQKVRVFALDQNKQVSPDLYLPDHLHLNTEGYKELVQVIRSAGGNP